MNTFQGAEGADALRLDKRTELNRSQKVVVVRDYGNGIVEVGLSSVPTPNQNEVDRRRHEPQPDLFYEQNPVHLDRSMRRTKATVRRKCMAGGLDHMLTLTYRANMIDTDQAYADLTRFIRLIRQTQPNWKYVAVSEYQERGSIHFHLAVKGFQNVRHLRALWLDVVGEGNIDVKGPKGKRTKWNLPKLAGYLTKYITKATCAAFGRHRYRVAEGIEIPRQLAIVSFPFGVDRLQEIFDSLGADINYRYESGDGWSWACSW